MRELSMRAAVGAGRPRIVRQLLTESVLLSFAGGAAGLAAAMAGVQGILAVFGDRLPRVESIGLDWRVLAYTAGVSLAGGLLLGLIPALRLSRIDLTEAMKAAGAGSAGGRRQQRWMSGLLASQVGLCMVAAVAAGLLINTVMRLEGVDRGFDPEGMVVASLDLPRDRQLAREFAAQILERAGTIPQVSAALTYDPRNISIWRTEFRRPGTNEEFGPGSPFGFRTVISPGYFETMHIPLLRGRDFAPGAAGAGTEGPLSVIISQSLAAKYWPTADPLGQPILLGLPDGEAPAEIVGIAGDVQGWVTAGPGETIYLDYRQAALVPEYLLVRGSTAAGTPMGTTLNTVRQVIRSLDPNQTFRTSGSYAALIHAEFFRRERELMTLLGWFAGLALGLTTVGVAGQVAYAVGRRTPEIAIRVSCGARPADLLRMFCGTSLKPVAAGLALGAAGALTATKYLERLLFEVTPTDPSTFLAAGAAILLAAALAALAAAAKATSVDPAITLRQE
jgi:predicted permease